MTESVSPPHKASTSSVSVRRALAAERPLVENLFQFYVYDFSEMIDPTSKDLTLNETGLFNIRATLSVFWSEPNHWPMLIESDDQIAGFALINTTSHCGQNIDRNMAEFFVARKYRRSGVATQALHQILAVHPGVWEIAIIDANTVAQNFWPTAIATAPNVTNLCPLDHDQSQWQGPIWTFTSRAKQT